MTIRMHDIEAGTTTDHNSIREAKAEYTKRYGKTPGSWSSWKHGDATFWERGDQNSRELDAIIWNAKHDEAFDYCFGLTR